VNGKDYYKVLSIAKTASEDEIKRAHRKLARKHHPDLNPGDKRAEEQFKEIQEAYDVLSDPEKRKKYDQFGENWAQVPPGYAPQPGNHTDPFSGGQPNTAAGQVNFEDLFSGIFGGARRGSPFGGNDVVDDAEFNLEVSLDDAYRGVSRRVNVSVEDVCSDCGGAGQKRNSRGQFELNGAACPKCRGRGRIASQRSVIVNIPAGAYDQMVLSQSGQGPADARGRRSDLHLRLNMLTNARFERDGQNLLFDIQVPYTVAALGGELPVETLGGQRRQLLIPPGIQTGQKLRLSGQGMPAVQDRSVGDAFARVRITVPRDLTDNEKQLLEQLAKLRQDPVRFGSSR
jgi:DnaJ-class molecular chaperone